MGPLENLTLDGCNLRPYLNTFLDTPIFPETIHPASFPAIKEFSIFHPVQSFRNKVYSTAIVELARSQHARGIPFEHVKFRMKVPSLVVDELVAFVGAVEYYEDTLSDGGGGD